MKPLLTQGLRRSRACQWDRWRESTPLRPKAEQVAWGVEPALAALVEAHAAWQAVEAEVMALMRIAGKGHERTPEFPAQLAEVVRDVGRFAGRAFRPRFPAASTASASTGRRTRRCAKPQGRFAA